MGGTCWPKANPGDQKGAEPPFLAGKLAERSNSDAKQAFQLVCPIMAFKYKPAFVI